MREPLLAQSLTRSFGDEAAAVGIDLTVEYGEIHAIVGLNGAGKTTLMRLLLGMLEPDTGRALVLGSEARTAAPDTWMKVGHLIETPFAYRELTVRENVAASALLHRMPATEIPRAVRRVVEDFELGHWADRRAGTLSLGNRQRLGLATALVHNPTVLVLDEPANALDPAGVVFTRDLLRRLAADGAAVLVSSHHFDQLARVADRITVLHRGRVVGSLDPDGIDLEQSFFELVHDWDIETGALR
ncbi:MAG: ABC transporter ATP-binding protein [Acidimicrobiia bacterium]|jgi:ABC-2 type transport system ATP-binding protein